MPDSRHQNILRKLDQAIQSGTMAANQREMTERLLSSITDPVRLTILGLPGSGKSTLVNLLLGKSVLGEGDRLPTVQIKLGERAVSTCTMEDGSKQVFDHCNSNQIAAPNAILLEMEMPLPALKKVSLLEVVAPENVNEQKRAMRWAAKRTDIAIWCTQEFGTAEQATWRGMSEGLKDHAYLLITKADVLASQGILDETMARLASLGDGEFKHILSIETKAAVNAKADGVIDKQKMTESGGRALISSIMRDVEQGKQAAYDRGELLLQQHYPATQSGGQAAETSADTPAPRSTPAPVTAEQPEPASAEPVIGEHLFPKTRIACSAAVTALTDSGRAMIREYNNNDALADDLVMKKSSESVVWLNDYLSDKGDAADPNLQPLLDITADASDLVQLHGLENSSQATLDAISLVVQLKRELESMLCAS